MGPGACSSAPRVHAQLGGGLRLFVSAGAFLPPALQQAWEDLGIVVMQGYGATETGSGACTTWRDHPTGHRRLADPGRRDADRRRRRGPVPRPHASPRATGRTRRRRRRRSPTDGFYRTGDLGHLDAKGRLVLHGRKRDIIVLPNGLNVFPEDIENALRVAGIRDSVVLETEPGRIEAIVLAPGPERVPVAGSAAAAAGRSPREQSGRSSGPRSTPPCRRPTPRSPPTQRIAAWRFWPDADFPRTHTLKVKRDQVRAWAAVAAPLPVTEAP